MINKDINKKHLTDVRGKYFILIAKRLFSVQTKTARRLSTFLNNAQARKLVLVVSFSILWLTMIIHIV